MIRVQIAGVSTLEEALFAARAGADALGFTLRLPHGPHDGLGDEGAARIVAALPPFVTPVAISYPKTAAEAIDLVRVIGARAIQFHGDIELDEVARFAEEEPWVTRVKSVSVTGEDAIKEASEWACHVDALILDTYDPATGRRGATGQTHDWRISREIVRRIPVPVILAGGLTPQNVAEAIRTVGPWGVDVHTGIENRDGTRNIKSIEWFIHNAKMPI
jgi:phosphoribosylanthranilate isomerase